MSQNVCGGSHQFKTTSRNSHCMDSFALFQEKSLTNFNKFITYCDAASQYYL